MGIGPVAWQPARDVSFFARDRFRDSGPMTTVREFTRPYCQRSNARAVRSCLATLAFYFLTLWAAIDAALGGLWAAAAGLIVLNAFGGVRLYVLQHDCGHASLFESRRLNDLAGYGLSTFTLTPFRAMQYNHNVHHAHIGDLDARDTGEIHTMTLREWENAPWHRRLAYRIYRNPLFLLPVGGLYTYLLRYRWPKNAMTVGLSEVMAQNAVLMAWLGLIWALAGVTGLWVWLATVFVAGMIGVFLVYLQHNFEDTYWDRRPDLSPRKAALVGASALDLGAVWDLATGNIAYHDIHHFNARIPSYNLRRCHLALRRELDAPVIHWPAALASFRLKLWDETAGKLVPFPRSPAPGERPGPVAPAR